ncbi:hypothetical protein HG535_0H03570 [Zygotorulaspora mrakii]|uniref:Protein CASP n=1 Tax=Zygotorulaspora mrakii TaxID=42260 RepID=A0A7H9B9A2_ZYGMR|nr:uncharacterized protein HG535_0H03570 [Zygotorulaspora mrakii]QLG75030.1 hypothetical protein HG535_0H03570 [Zygotorulaspora mrakii]
MDPAVYQHAYDLWSKVDLTVLQKQLDKDVIEIKEKETLSLESRKLLASETKKFKKLDIDEKLSQINKIIKQYQQEVDSLTKRSKNSEVILLDVYAKIAEAPDPKSLLRDSAVKLSKVDDTKVLQERIDTLEDKLAKYADYDTLKSRLLDLEQKSAETLVKRVSAKEQELNKTWEEKQRNWNGREDELVKQIEILRSSNEALEKKLSNGAPMAGNIETATAKFTNSSEYNILAQELEASQTRIFQLEKRNEELSGSLARATSEVEQELQLQAKDSKIMKLESENALLIASSDRNRKMHSKESTEIESQLKSLRAETDSYKSEITTLRMKLANFSDYNQLKQDLSALKRIEFGAEDDEEDGSQNHNGNEQLAGNGQIKMEASLVSANKRLQRNLAELRGKYAENEEEDRKLKTELMALKEKVNQLESSNKKLEMDLDKIEEVDLKFNDTASMMSGVTRQMNNRGGKLSPTSSIIGIPEEMEGPSIMGNNTILPIITKQRDRLRQRNSELEREMKRYGIDKKKIMNELTKLKNDNNGLYERIRYLSRNSNNNSKNNKNNLSNSDSNGSSHANINNNGNNDLISRLDAESQYSQVYEDSLNPLAKFKENEIEYYRKNRLSIWEKLFSSFAKIVLSNKVTRMLFLFYCVGLHCLIFMMSMYVINLSGYMTPEVGIKQSSNANLR